MIGSSLNTASDFHKPLGLRLLTRLTLGLSHLNKQKFNRSFKNCVNTPCTCSLEIKSTSHFFLHSDHYNNICSAFLNELKFLDGNIWKRKLSDTTFTNLILYGGLQNKIPSF